MLSIHTLKPARRSKHAKKRVGRGNASGHGTTATKGGKGQTARAGGARGNQARSFKRLLQSTPKLRGFTSFRAKPAEVYLTDLEQKFASGDTVTVDVLHAKNLIPTNAKSAKVLNSGELKKKLIFSGILFTKSAAEKVIAAGGEIK